MRNKLLLLISSLVSLGLLVAAAVRENVYEEWRVLQAAAAGPSGPIEVRLRQIVVPATGVADRCVTCHVGMAAGEPVVAGDRVLKPHPNVVHDPGAFGCTVCHGGQSRATTSADAHGHVAFWPEPMIPRAYADAGCGSCHTQINVPDAPALRAGFAAFERNDCLSCHRLDGRGGTIRPSGHGMEGPDLSRVGATGYRADWHPRHVVDASRSGTLAWSTFRSVSAEDQSAIRVLLESRHGAPGLVEAKATFQTLGCRGCHKIGGVGGSDGPDLSLVGRKDPGRLDFTHVVTSSENRHDLGAWFAEHFRAPATVVAGSRMPAMGLSEPDIDRLVHYMFSLRGGAAAGVFWPKDRMRAERLGERDFATDGPTLYGTFCAACHGPAGQGMRYPGMAPFPAIASASFLAIASDEFLTQTIRRGRPGRRMAGWEGDGGLRPEEISEIVRYVRFLGGTPFRGDSRPERWVGGDAAEGARFFAQNCALCHGPKGEGTDEGMALNNAVLLETATDTYLTETIGRGRAGTTMQPFLDPGTTHRALDLREIESIVAFLRTWAVPADPKATEEKK
jgi:mono/diheme cytochrome c family protein